MGSLVIHPSTRLCQQGPDTLPASGPSQLLPDKQQPRKHSEKELSHIHSSDFSENEWKTLSPLPLPLLISFHMEKRNQDSTFTVTLGRQNFLCKDEVEKPHKIWEDSAAQKLNIPPSPRFWGSCLPGRKTKNIYCCTRFLKNVEYLIQILNKIPGDAGKDRESRKDHNKEAEIWEQEIQQRDRNHNSWVKTHDEHCKQQTRHWRK